MMRSTDEDLRARLRSIDGRGYPAYKQIVGTHVFSSFRLTIDRVQRDPFAPSTRVRISVPWDSAGFHGKLVESRSRRVGLCDFLTRRLLHAARARSRCRGSGHSGELQVSRPGQEVLERSSVLASDVIEARLTIGLPAQGRRIDGDQAEALFLEDLPALIDSTLFANNYDRDSVESHVAVVEDQDVARALIREKGLCAFVADGSILPRRTGADDRPKEEEEAVSFESPRSIRVTLDLPNAGRVAGMGIPCGVTLIVGGGYHGKSTLLQALERGVYNHISGDGREGVVTSSRAVKIRAEEGRAVTRVDLRPFINNLPQGCATSAFTTTDASGSTSQATNIVEALESGADLLLIDEDTSAANFMVRDRRMQALVEREGEPITPFVDRARHLYQERGVSTILVAGSSGDYLDVADRVIRMDSYRAQDVTGEAREIVQRHPTGREAITVDAWPTTPRMIEGWPSGTRRPRVRVDDSGRVEVDGVVVDLGEVDQIADRGQLLALAYVLRGVRNRTRESPCDFGLLCGEIEEQIEKDGLDALTDEVRGDLSRPRYFEIAAAVNRVRELEINEGA